VIRACRYQTAFICALLFFLTLAIYWPVHRYDFVEFDDPDYVFDNAVVRAGLTHWGLVWAFVDAHSSNWHPLTWLSHMLDCQLFGVNPGAHHLVNVLFHCANAVLLFLLLRSLTEKFWPGAFVAAIFAWHPLRVESVAWIAERKDVLSGFFFMLTLMAYVRYVKWPAQPLPARKKWASLFPRADFYKLSLFCFVLGLLSKPMLVTVPIVLLLLDFWPLKRFQFSLGARKTTFGVPREVLLEKIPFFLIAAVFSFITIVVQKPNNTAIFSSPSNLFFPVESVGVNYLGYLEKIFWPQNLSILYLRPETINAGQFILAALVLLCVSIFAVFNFQRRPYLIFGWLWFLAMLFPVSGIIQFGRQSIADRYTYLPSIGLAVALTWGFMDLASLLFSQRARQMLLTLTVSVVLLACVLVTRHQLAYWQNTETLMNHALKLDPKNYVAHNNLAFYFLRRGDQLRAEEQFKLVTKYGPKRH
jgi:protein O-mannosyl-transferase